MPKFLTEDTQRGRLRVTEPVPCAICKQHTHNLDLIWQTFICSDECEAEYTRDYVEANRQAEGDNDESNV